MWLWQWETCRLHNLVAHWEAAIEWCNRALASDPQAGWIYADLAAANAWDGHAQEAKDAAAKLNKVYPGFTVQGWSELYFSDNPAYKAQMARFGEGLRKAGLPVCRRRMSDMRLS